jgi:hypothetical protein
MRPTMMPGIALPQGSPKHSSRCGGSSTYLPDTRLAPQLAQINLSSGFLVPHLTHKVTSVPFPITAYLPDRYQLFGPATVIVRSQRLGRVIAATMTRIPKMINTNGQALGRCGTNASSNVKSPKRTRAAPMNGRNHGLGTPKHSSSLSRRRSSGGGGTERVGMILPPSSTALQPFQSFIEYVMGKMEIIKDSPTDEGRMVDRSDQLERH